MNAYQIKADWEDFRLANGIKAKENQTMSPIEQELNQLLQHSRATYDALASKFAALKAQRDEMAEALKACAEALAEVPCISNKQEAAKVNARALLAKLEGGGK